MSLPVIVFSFVVILLVLVAFHELGHMVVAKRAGVKVEEFGIGLPPRLFAVKRGETEYSLNLIPLGAFVKTPGESDPTVPDSLASKGPWTRFKVYAAGPLANILMAFIILSIFFMMPSDILKGDGTMVHSVTEGSPAEVAGIKSGDVILKIDDEEIHNSKDVRNKINATGSAEKTFLLLRDGEQFETSLEPEYDPEQDRQTIGIVLCWGLVTQVQEGSPAEDADIRPGAAIYAINSEIVYSEESMLDALNSAEVGEEVELIIIDQDQELVSASLILPDSTNELQSIGIESKWVSNSRIESESLYPWQAVWNSGDYMISLPAMIRDSIPMIRDDPSLAAVGVVGGLQLTIEAVEYSGFRNILLMGGMISVGLALFNFLPVPPLDGGGMLISAIEWVRRGKRLPPEKVRLAYVIGITLMVTVFVVIMYNDITRLIDYFTTGESGFGL